MICSALCFKPDIICSSRVVKTQVVILRSRDEESDVRKRQSLQHASKSFRQQARQSPQAGLTFSSPSDSLRFRTISTSVVVFGKKKVISSSAACAPSKTTKSAL